MITITAPTIRRQLKEKRRHISSDLFAEKQRAKGEKENRHYDENQEVRPVFEKLCATKNNGAHERNEIRGREDCAHRVKNPGHGFAWKNEAGKENARQHERHRYLEGLHLVLGFGGDEQAQTKQRKHVNERRKHHRKHATVDRDPKQKTHQQEKERGHGHADAEIRHQFAEHQSPAAERTHRP